MKILIIDIETTDFLKRGGKIVEIGITGLDLSNGARWILFNEVIDPNLSIEELNENWIVKNGYMSVSEIIGGKQFLDIKDRLQGLVSKYPCTAYNRSFDIDFLVSYGITFPKLLPCPMLLATDVCKLPAKYGYKRPKVEEAYKFLFNESEYVEKHRGADDSLHEAEIVYALYKLGVFKV